uniref:Uncharacterized protein n=1 Tax=Arundo donax TaxID=35708 RepID=A0A0A9ALL9_ARUDO
MRYNSFRDGTTPNDRGHRDKAKYPTRDTPVLEGRLSQVSPTCKC